MLSFLTIQIYICAWLMYVWDISLSSHFQSYREFFLVVSTCYLLQHYWNNHVSLFSESKYHFIHYSPWKNSLFNKAVMARPVMQYFGAVISLGQFWSSNDHNSIDAARVTFFDLCRKGKVHANLLYFCVTNFVSLKQCSIVSSLRLNLH